MDRRRKCFCRACFAGGTNANPVESERQLLGFLTTEGNDVIGAIHPKAMPAILTTPAEIETWMTAPAEEALSFGAADL
jgi:putative SOS response-associated peptidase YedK